MSKQVVEKIKRIAKKPFKTCYKCYQDLEAGKTGEIPDCCNDCELFKEWVPLNKLLGLLDGYEQKLKELADLLKNRPYITHEDWREIKPLEEWFQKVRKKVVELTGKEREKST